MNININLLLQFFSRFCKLGNGDMQVIEVSLDKRQFRSTAVYILV